MSQIAIPEAIEHSHVMSIRIKDNETYIRAIIPRLSDTSEILKAEAFSYREIVDDQVCEFKYIGPEFTIYNFTSQCVRPLYKSKIFDNVYIGKGCRKSESIREKPLYEQYNCRKVSNNTAIIRPKVQFRHDGQKLEINCQEYKIVINNQSIGCPNYVFSLDNEASFSIDNINYQYTRSNITATTSFEIQKHINLHLGIIKSEFQALTADEIAKLEEEGMKAVSAQRTEKVQDSPNWLGLPNFTDIIHNIHSFIDGIGEYVALAFAILVICLLCFPRRRRRERASAPMNMYCFNVLAAH